jgi:pimeloyl-ACP methyl ester carboxylesterase
MFGVSASGELALAMGLRHPDLYDAILCASPGGGFRPPGVMPTSLPRTYLVAGDQEPFFLENATRWAEALRHAGADVVMFERPGAHGGPWWQQELGRMVVWLLGGRLDLGDDGPPPLPRDGKVGIRRPRLSDPQDRKVPEVAIRRFDGSALYRALDARRREQGLSWRKWPISYGSSRSSSTNSVTITRSTRPHSLGWPQNLALPASTP